MILVSYLLLKISHLHLALLGSTVKFNNPQYKSTSETFSRIKGTLSKVMVAIIHYLTVEVFSIIQTSGCSLPKGYRLLKTTRKIRIQLIKMPSNIETTTTLYLVEIDVGAELLAIM